MQVFVYDALPARVVFGSGTVAQIKPEAERLRVIRLLVFSTSGRGEAQAQEIAALLDDLSVGVHSGAVMHTPVAPALGSWLGAGERQVYPMLHFEHPVLTQLMLHLDRILAQSEMYSRVYVESFATVLLAEIMACQAIDLSRSRHPERRPPVRGGLASWQCKAVCDYIEDNLHQDISLAELAAIARLSPYHFCRAFKETVGEPPHRYQMGRRIEQAKTLLAKPSLSVSDVAAAVGYGSLSRFSALFRQITGYSPREYQRQMT